MTRKTIWKNQIEKRKIIQLYIWCGVIKGKEVRGGKIEEANRKERYCVKVRGKRSTGGRVLRSR
jgi:hypothetical protein